MTKGSPCTCCPTSICERCVVAWACIYFTRSRVIPELPGLSACWRHCVAWQTEKVILSCRLSCCWYPLTGEVRCCCRARTVRTSATGGAAASCAEPDRAVERLADEVPAQLRESQVSWSNLLLIKAWFDADAACDKSQRIPIVILPRKRRTVTHNPAQPKWLKNGLPQDIQLRSQPKLHRLFSTLDYDARPSATLATNRAEVAVNAHTTWPITLL